MRPASFLKPYLLEKRFSIALGLFSLIVVDLLQLFIPRVIKRTVDDLAALKATHLDLFYYALSIALIAAFIGIFRYVWRRCLLGMSRRVEEGLRNQLLKHIQILTPAYFDSVKSGDLMARATNDIQQIRMATGMGLVALNDALVMGTASIGFMLYINIELTLIVLIPMPFLVLSARIFTRKMHRHYKLVQSAFADMTEVVRERFSGMRIIKAYTREANEKAQVHRASEEYVGKNMDLVKIVGSFFPLMILLTNMSLVLVLFLGGRMTIETVITPGDFVAFISYLGMLTWPMMAMGWVINLIQQGRASLDRIHHILTTQPELEVREDLASPSEAPTPATLFKLANVSFTYNSNSQPALKNINLEVETGSTIGLVGPPGSGKTTLLRLLPRLYDPTAGKIFYQGLDLRSFPLDELRSNFAYMPQKPFLFAGSIKENITLGREDFSDKELQRVIQQAALEETVQDLEKGLETLVGERGVILSGGQKQRITLARTLLYNAPVLLLDDPISQVDTQTGQKIIQTIQETAAHKTVFIVSHRLAALRFAQHILTFKQGIITESGSHEELAAQDSYYGHTLRLQELEEELNAY